MSSLARYTVMRNRHDNKEHRMKTGIIALTVAAFAAAAPFANASETPMTAHAAEQQSGLHDFDFLMGEWRVRHRRLKERLAGNNQWIEFAGTLSARKLMEGAGNVEDNFLDLPGGAYRAVGLRSFDAKSGQWSIWWLDGRMPLGPLDPPVRGRFENGVGTFLAEDTFNGKPIRVRYVWSQITRVSCRWEQAFSPDGGKTWETNWVMDFTRVS
jgi:hypothetical protein